MVPSRTASKRQRRHSQQRGGAGRQPATTGLRRHQRVNRPNDPTAGQIGSPRSSAPDIASASGGGTLPRAGRKHSRASPSESDRGAAKRPAGAVSST